ncbi:BnaC08g41510D [Brassica napus]|uniref:BnaC08g41510D protein n=1 Tax=Brassica napus TaxID=3708 RepID=A0A078FSZ0_BRANA|nr:BnaC08g41510D [Brassica napus]
MKLPCEFVEEILFRVPPLSLLRCKTVCKQWNTLLNHMSLVRPQLLIWTGPKIYSVGVNLKDDPKIDIRELPNNNIPIPSNFLPCDGLLFCVPRWGNINRAMIVVDPKRVTRSLDIDDSSDIPILSAYRRERFSVLKQFSETNKIEIWVTENKISGDGANVVWMEFMTVSIPFDKDFCPSYFIDNNTYGKSLVMCCKDEDQNACIYVVKGNASTKIPIGFDVYEIMANIRVQKGPESPRTEVGEIDTRAPFQSVKAAVSLFGEVVSRQRSTTRRSRLSSESVCDKETQLMLAHKQFLKIKQKLDNAEITRSRALSDLSNAKKTMEELTNKLEAVNKSKQSAIDTKETVQQREDQLEHDKSHGSPPHHHELDVAREQYLSTTIELDAAKQQLNKIKQSFDSAMDLKATALNQAAEAKRALQVNSAKVNELSKEIGDMKDAIHQLKLAATQNLEEYANIVKEKDDLRECYKTAVEEAEKKLLVLRKEYQPELSRNIEAKLIETTSEIEVLREEMKKAHESEMNTVKIITNELNEATMKLQEAADEEGSLRSLVNSLRMELEDMRREREELQQREAERLEVEERKKVEALKEESLRLEEMKQEALVARNEAEEMNRKIESLKKETDSAMIAAEEAEKRLELVIREVEEAKAAEEKVREEMKMISQKQESKKQDEESSGSKIKITVQEFESLKRGAGETEKAVEKKLGDIAGELEEINKRKAEGDNKLGASLKAIEEMKHATDLAQKAADSAEAAKSVVENLTRTNLSCDDVEDTEMEASYYFEIGSFPFISDSGLTSDRNLSYKEKLRSGIVGIKKDDAVTLFQTMTGSRPLPTLVDFSKLFILSSIASAGVVNLGRVFEAMELVDRMVQSQHVPDLITLNTIVNGLCLPERVSEAVDLID